MSTFSLHFPQGYLISVHHEVTFYAILDYFLTLFDAYIAHKDISSLHELIFFADLDILLSLIDAYIAHINIS